MLIPLINPCGGHRKKRNPIVFKSGQERIMEAFKRYAKRRITHGSMKMRKSTRVSMSKFSTGPFYSTTGRLISNPGKEAVRGLFPAIIGISAIKDKRPAKSRGTTRRNVSTQQEGSMVYSLKRRPRRKSRRARHNPYRESGFMSRLTGGGKKRRAHRRIRLGAHRPIVIRTASHGWRRPKRSKLFRHSVRINPRRGSRRLTHRGSRRLTHRYRRNPFSLPKLPFNLQNVAFGGLKIAGGIALGMFVIPQIEKYIPKKEDKVKPIVDRKYFGLVHVIIGAVVATMVKKQLIRDMALTFAGVGVYDLIQQNLLPTQLPELMKGECGYGEEDECGYGEEPGVIGMEADMEPTMLGSSYQSALGSSYGADDIAYGSDNDSLDC